MEITESLKCECNDRVYPNRTSLNTHRKTKMHRAWESDNEVRILRCECKRLENENEALKLDLKVYRNIILKHGTYTGSENYHRKVDMPRARGYTGV